LEICHIFATFSDTKRLIDLSALSTNQLHSAAEGLQSHDGLDGQSDSTMILQQQKLWLHKNSWYFHDYYSTRCNSEITPCPEKKKLLVFWA